MSLLTYDPDAAPYAALLDDFNAPLLEAIVTAAARKRAIAQARASEAANFKLASDQLVLLRNALRSAQQATMERMVDTTKAWEYSQTKALMQELDAQLMRIDGLMVQQTQGLQAQGWNAGETLLPDMLQELKLQVQWTPRIDSKLLDIAQATVPELISGVTRGIKSDVSRLLRNAALGQWPVYDLMHKIGTVTGKGPWASAFARGEAIYRTEQGRMYGAANLGRLEELGKTEDGWMKEWVSSEDVRVRFDHVKANGQRVPTDGYYEVGGEKALYPLDPNLSARQSIHCRCLSVPWHPDFDTPVGAKQQAEPFDFDQELARLHTEPSWDALRNQGMSGPELRSSGRQSPWRTVSLTDTMLQAIAKRSTDWEALLRLRYGIEAASGASTQALRYKTLKGLETYRAQSGAYVTEAEYLKRMEFGQPFYANSSGETSLVGRILFSVKNMKDMPARFSKDGQLEVVLHELGHTVANMFGIHPGYGSEPPGMWAEWQKIHNASRGIMNEGVEKVGAYTTGVKRTREQERQALADLTAKGGDTKGDWNEETMARANEGHWRWERQEYENAKAWRIRQEGLLEAAKQLATPTAQNVDYYPTQYAQTGTGRPGSAVVEDFAESVAAFLAGSELFKTYCPARVSFLQRWLNLR